MAIAAGIPTPATYVVDDPALNAYAVSDGRRHGAVVVTTGLLAIDRPSRAARASSPTRSPTSATATRA